MLDGAYPHRARLLIEGGYYSIENGPVSEPSLRDSLEPRVGPIREFLRYELLSFRLNNSNFQPTYPVTATDTPYNLRKCRED